MNASNPVRVGVVLVNWRGWRDTLLALETLFAGDYVHFDAVVVDNNSGDDSVEHILAWAQGREVAVLPSLLGEKVRVRAEQEAIPHTLLDESELAAPPVPSRLTVSRPNATAVSPQATIWRSNIFSIRAPTIIFGCSITTPILRPTH